jgi:hypothetical protein
VAVVASQPSVTSSATLIADATDTDNQRGVSVLVKNTTASATASVTQVCHALKQGG